MVTHRFIKPFKARFVKLHPKSWYSYISMRMELYGCRHGKLKVIPVYQMSIYSITLSPDYALSFKTRKTELEPRESMINSKLRREKKLGF